MCINFVCGIKNKRRLIMKKVFNCFICFIFDYKWISKVMKGIKLIDVELNFYMGYKYYVKMYCDWCGMELKLNNRL